MNLKNLVTSFLSVLLVGCSALAPKPTATPTLTFTPPPTETRTPTNTSEPTNTPKPTPTKDVIASLLPVGEPAEEWNGIPIMPGAIAGEGDDAGYRFTIKANSDDIQEYYERELSKLGWQFLAAGQGENGTLILIFTGSEGTLSVSLLPHEDEFIVVLVK